MSENNLIGMIRVNGPVSEIHGAGFIAKPDEHGVVYVKAEFVVSLLQAGFMFAIQNTTTRTPAQTT